MAIIGLFQCDPWCLPTLKWLKNATNDISIQDFYNITRHYEKYTARYYVAARPTCLNLRTDMFFSLYIKHGKHSARNGNFFWTKNPFFQSQGSFWGCGGKTPARVSEYCLVVGLG